jgi:Kef-type K+ transport system membrane component KefB/nucleotide-binding universal stress UspA family protein
VEVFTAASHHDVLVLVVQIAALLFAARLFGEIAKRLNQPPVVGEILAGIILGPSLLSGFVPFIREWLLPQTPVQGYLLEVVSLLGAMFLLLITGLETDLMLIRRHARTAFGVSFGGIITTFSSGFVLGQFLPDFLLGNPNERLVFALFVATAMSISAIPVIAKVLMDLNLMRRDIGQTIIAAGMSDDTTGWILLSIVSGLASGQAITAGSVVQIVGSVLAFMVLSFTLGRILVKKLFDFAQDELVSEDRLLTLVIVLTFVWGAITQALNLEAVLGAFVMGILIGQIPRLPTSIYHKLESLSLGIFTPIFFAVAGLKVNLRSLLEPGLLLIALLVILIALMGKVVGTYVGARVFGKKDHWTALSFGAGLNARGAMEIIIATIGLNLGILSQEMFSVIVLMAISTSLMAPPMLKWVLKRVQPDEQELQRLQREQMTAGSLVAQIHRVLLPVRERRIDDVPAPTIEASVLKQIGESQDLSLTLMNVPPLGGAASGRQFVQQLAQYFPLKEVLVKVLEHDAPAEVILDELEKDYDLLVLGASAKNKGSSVLFTPIVDYLVRLSPVPTMVVRGQRVDLNWKPRCILVPTNGSRSARNAAELAFALVSGEDPQEEVILLNVVTDNLDDTRMDINPHIFNRRLEAGKVIVEELGALGKARQVRVKPMVRTGRDVESTIFQAAAEEQADLIILGADVHIGSERLFLSSRVEFILENADCPVIVFNS